MPEEIAGRIVAAFAIYSGIGLCAAVIFVSGGLRVLDPLAASAPWRVKLLITPGIIALWPVLLFRSFGLRPPEDRQ